MLKSFYQQLKSQKKQSRPLLTLSSWQRTILKNLDGQVLRTTWLGDQPVKYLDAFGFLHSYEEIFEDKVYYFECENKSPLIIDCGSNIGLSILYFKHLFPESTVIGFEPDPILFELLKSNVAAFKLSNIDLRNEAVWNNDEYLFFETDPSLSGHLVANHGGVSSNQTVKVKAMRLKNFLAEFEAIDFLKIDIESAEMEVMEDIAELLPRVRNVFVEFHNSGGKYLHDLSRILSVLESSGFRYYLKEAFAFDSPFTFEGRKNIPESWNPFNISAVNMR